MTNLRKFLAFVLWLFLVLYWRTRPSYNRVYTVVVQNVRDNLECPLMPHEGQRISAQDICARALCNKNATEFLTFTFIGCDKQHFCFVPMYMHRITSFASKSTCDRMGIRGASVRHCETAVRWCAESSTEWIPQYPLHRITPSEST